VPGLWKKGEIKNEGSSHDVIENTCRKISHFCHATMLMKIKDKYVKREIAGELISILRR